MARCHLHKFGGSSLADADCYRRVAHILLTQGHSDDLVVVSAAGKSTNFLFNLLSLKLSQQLWQEALSTLIHFQQQLIEQLLSSEPARNLRERLATDQAQLVSLLSLESLTPYQSNQVISFGERWSARLLAALLRESDVAAIDVDARSLLIAEEAAVPQINTEISTQKVQALLAAHPNERIIITGFICAKASGETLLLGRNGSDFSATLIASLADIERVTIWTDVEGVFNADPNKINDAKLLSSLSLDEADRLAHLGSPVLHNRTLQPLFNTEVSLAVRSSYAPHTDFTLISPHSLSASAPVVTNIASVSLLQLKVNLDRAAVLAHFNRAELSPLAHWISPDNKLELAFTHENAAQAQALLSTNRAAWGVSELSVRTDLGLVALVSADAALYRRGFARLLTKDAKPLFNDNLSLVTLIPQAQVNLLTQKVHRRCAGPRKRIGVLLLGVGNIGAAWLSLFNDTRAQLNRELEASVDLIGLVNSNKAWICEQGIEGIVSDNWRSHFDEKAQAWQFDPLLSALDGLECDELIALDLSASQPLTSHYPAFFSRGIHLVSANKLAGSGPLSFYRDLKAQLDHRRLFWRYNASCGAGLPVQHALNDLHIGGDRIQSIGGIFSGTLCWLFEHFDGIKPFSHWVLEAKALGITEPDPRDDLSGLDMQRKLLILGREIGLALELEDIKLQSLIPSELAALPLDEFIAQMDLLDPVLQQAFEAAKAQNKVLRYVATLDDVDGEIKAEVSLKWFDSTHAYANLTPGDNVFVIHSQTYQDNPLIIRGPGAGREVTAAAVQSDLAHICYDLVKE